MSWTYERLPDPGPGLRLHLNENTAGCSPRVIEALHRLTREDAAFYPDYGRVTRHVAAHLGVDPARVLVTNGLDEGLHAAALATLLRGEDGLAREAIVVEPAFDMYAASADAVGGRVVAVPPRDDFSFPLEELLGALTARTGIVYLASPNNPTGLAVPREAISVVAAALPEGALLFLDEAYADFADGHCLDLVERLPNLVVGRTFAKALGLAALRAGAVVAQEPMIARLRRVVPPYSVNVAAAAATIAALEDTAYQEWYRNEVRTSRELVYRMCERLGLQYWPSQANFVLVRIGDAAGELVRALAERRIFVRDRSNQPGCRGCVRLTTGVVAHTARLVEAVEAVLCGGR
jgi:histidinol-phosphate aminotransferase